MRKLVSFVIVGLMSLSTYANNNDNSLRCSFKQAAHVLDVARGNTNYKDINKNDAGAWIVDMASVTKNSDGTISVWVALLADKEFSVEDMGIGKIKLLFKANDKDVSKIVGKIYFTCSGTVLDKEATPDAKWELIEPGSIIQAVRYSIMNDSKTDFKDGQKSSGNKIRI